MSTSMRRTATVDYRVSRIPVLCKDCRQDVGLYPARHTCGNGFEAPPPLPIVDLSAVAMNSKPQPNSNTSAEKVQQTKVAVGKGWEAVRNMNWRDMTRKEQENNGSRMWGRLLEATSSARQRVADKYHEVREGGNESDDDAPDNTHTQRVLAQYYLSTEGVLPPWLSLPSSMAASTNITSSQRPTPSNASSVSGSSMYRAGNKPVSLQDIYDSAGANQPTNRARRSQDLYASDHTSTGRQPLASDRLRNKLRPSNSRSSPQSTYARDRDPESSGTTPSGGSSAYSGRSGFGGGPDYDPYNYQYQTGRETNRPHEGHYGTGMGNRSGSRR